ncbi:MAG: MFS transporter [Deltaproteobacteria bacterium]|jgi:EmrB/QacA subfamily drug resistance transporter|nr:MFS transporter [Deltaproteobacteria bacterium]MBT7713730.1 MFS transporter [Deltaproteobacteria bacterium]
MKSLPVDYSRKWLTMSAVSMGIFLATIDGSIVNVALPTLVKEFNTDFSIIQWVVLGYLLTVSTLILGIGRLGDMLGKKKLYAAGFIVFTLGSVLCGLSPTVYWLIGFRVLQGLGSALIMALGMAIVTEAFPPQERGMALGITGAVVSVGIAIGPSLGGLIISQLSWRWIFFVNLPVGILGTLMVLRFVHSLNPTRKQKFDYVGAVALFFSLACLLLGMTLGQQIGFNRLPVYVLLGGWLVLMGLFIWIEWRTREPMINLDMFKNRLLSINLTNAFISFIGISGTIILLPFYLQNILGHDMLMVGLLLCVIPVTMGISSPLAGALSDRFGTRIISVIGLLLSLVGFYAASTMDGQTSTLGYVLRIFPLGLGMGIFHSPNNSAIMGAVPPSHLGIASGLVSVARTLGQTVGIAILGAFWAGRTFYYAGANLGGGATRAPLTAQISALQDTFLMVVGFIAITILLSAWSFFDRTLDQTVR